MRRIASLILESLGFEVIVAVSGEAGFIACDKNKIDCILLDSNMPRMDGFTFLKEFRSIHGNDKIKVIYCHHDNDVKFIARALHIGANEYLLKPFDKDQVEAKLKEVGLI